MKRYWVNGHFNAEAVSPTRTSAYVYDAAEVDAALAALRARVKALEDAMGNAAVALQGRQYYQALAWLIVAMPTEDTP